MDIRKIKTLIEMLEGSTLKEIEVSQGDESVRISKQTNDVDVIEKDKRGYSAVKIGYFKIKNSKLTKQMKGYFTKKNTEPKKRLKEFRVEKLEICLCVS